MQDTSAPQEGGNVYHLLEYKSFSRAWVGTGLL